jgi:pentose-5-phosphate-3-epimerase
MLVKQQNIQTEASIVYFHYESNTNSHLSLRLIEHKTTTAYDV